MELNTFLYFAYGSNLLTKRIHINNPSAVRKGIGKLKVKLIHLIIFQIQNSILITFKN